MKEYIFENVLNSSIKIYIKAAHFTAAFDLLCMEVKCFDDYKLIN